MNAPSDSPTAGDTVLFRPKQPIPIDHQIIDVGGMAVIMRLWATDKDVAACRLCPLCTARNRACMVATEEAVTDGGAPLYSSWGLDFGEPLVPRGRTPLGLVGG